MDFEKNSLTTAKEIIDFLILLPQIVGLLFNIPTFIVFSRKKFQNTIFSTYFRYLCISDTITLLFRLEYLFNLKSFDHRSNSIYSCKILGYFVYLIPSFSIWILVVISIDRFVSIAYPTRFLFRKLKKYQITISLSIIVFHAFYWLPAPFLANISSNNSKNESNNCYPGTLAVDIMDLMDSSLLPSFFMFISTSLTLRVIFKSRRRSQNNQDHQQSRTKSKDVKFAISSISLNVFFFILNMPLTSFFLIRNFVEIHLELKRLIRSICEILYHTNYANIFFISYIFNSMFRKEFISFIREFKLKYL
jgi:hypothetical protein